MIADDNEFPSQEELPAVRELQPASGLYSGELLPSLPGTPDSRTDRYELRNEIARGSLSTLFRAWDKHSERELVLKVLHPELRGDRSAVLCFFEEARLSGRLQHPGIAPLHDMGCLADGAPYIALKLVDGRTFGELLARRMSPLEHRQQVLTCFHKVCQTVAYAHSRGVIHRDLKPTQVMVGAFGEAQIMDWSLARVLGPGKGGLAGGPGPNADPFFAQTIHAAPEDSSHWSRFDVTTAPYMSPEQARENVAAQDERTDVFGLGAILCEIVTGEPPYPDRLAEGSLARARGIDLASAFARLDASGFDREIVSLACRCLAPDPARRPAHAGLVADSLGAYLASSEERVRQAQLAAAVARGRAAAERESKRKTALLYSVMLAAVLIAIAAVLWVAEKNGSRAQQAALQVNLALEEAQKLRLEARARPEDDIAAWTSALEAASRADALSREVEIESSARARIDELKETLAAELARARDAAKRAERNRDVMQELTAVRNAYGGAFPWPIEGPPYASILRDHGIEVETVPVDSAAASIQATGIPAEIAQSLDHLAQVQLWLGRERSPEWTRWIEIAHRVDPDPVRERARRALLENDLDGLVEFSISGEPARSSVESRRLVDSNLLLLIVSRSKIAEQLARLRSIAASLLVEPASGRAWAEAAALLGSGEAPLAAIAALRQAVRAEPENAGLHAELCRSLCESGLMVEATVESQIVTRLRPQEGASWLLQARAFEGLGDLGAAVRAAEEGVLMAPLDPELHLSLGRLLKESGRLAEASQSLQRGLTLGSAKEGWSSPSAVESLAECRILLELEPRFEDFRRGATRPVDNNQRLLLAKLAEARSCFCFAARLYAEAFRWDAALLGEHFLRGAKAATRAAAGYGVDSHEASDGERAAFVRWALDWLTAGVRASDEAHSVPSQRSLFARDLRQILADINLAPLRVPDSLPSMVPVRDREAIHQFWLDLRERAPSDPAHHPQPHPQPKRTVGP